MNTKPNEKFTEIDRLIAEEKPGCEAILNWALEHDKPDSDDFTMSKVVECYRICAQNNMPVAWHNLGALYYLGRYVQQDRDMAAECYEKAAKMGMFMAYCNLGYCYYYNKIDYKKAFECFMLGASLAQDGNCYFKLMQLFRTQVRETLKRCVSRTVGFAQ